VECLKTAGKLEAVIAVKSVRRDDGFTGKVSHSQPPWNSAVAFAVMSLHQLARDIEVRLRVIAELPVRRRGGSDSNTRLALEAAASLAETASDAAVCDVVNELDRWLRQAKITMGELEFPQRLPRLPGKSEPTCPFCKHKTLRMFPLRGFIICITPDCLDEEKRKPRAVMEYSSFTCQFELVWQDNIVGVPVEEAA
jgi:hypothetical protein